MICNHVTCWSSWTLCNGWAVVNRSVA